MPVPNRFIYISESEVEGKAYVDVDGDGIPDIDVSGINPDIYAVQWYGTYGEVEYIDTYPPKERVKRINSLEEIGVEGLLTRHSDARAHLNAKEALQANEDAKIKRITKLQCKKQAIKLGIWNDVRAAINADPEVKEDWDLASELEIDDPMVMTLAAGLGFDDDRLQTFFNNAAGAGS